MSIDYNEIITFLLMKVLSEIREKYEKKVWLHGDLNPDLLACLAEALPLDQGSNEL